VHRLLRQRADGRRPDRGLGRAVAVVFRAWVSALSHLLPVLRKTWTGVATRTGVLLRDPVHHRSGAGVDIRRRLPLGADRVLGDDLEARPSRFSNASGRAIPGLGDDGDRRAAVPDAYVLWPGRAGGGAGPARAASDGR